MLSLPQEFGDHHAAGFVDHNASRRGNLLNRSSFGYLLLSRNVFGSDPEPQILAVHQCASKPLYLDPPEPINPGTKLIHVCNVVCPISHPVGPFIRCASGAGGLREADSPACRSSASVAKNHASHLVAKPFHFFRIFRTPEALGETEEFLLLPLFGFHTVLDEFEQYPIRAHLAGLCPAPNLRSDIRWQCYALPYRFSFGSHYTMQKRPLRQQPNLHRSNESQGILAD
jgi:hypothetical protein